jgi:hypothetical protein
MRSQLPISRPPMPLEFQDVVALVDSNPPFRDFLTRSLIAGEVMDAGLVLHAWRGRFPDSHALDDLDHAIRNRGLSDAAVFRSRAFFCAHAFRDPGSVDSRTALWSAC